VSAELWLFIALAVFDDDDRFAVEIAWSENEDFPWSCIGKLLNIGALCWRGRLTNSDGREMIWDLAPEVTKAIELRLDALRNGIDDAFGYPAPPPIDVVIPRIESAVGDCLARIEQRGFSILRRVAEFRGKYFPGEPNGDVSRRMAR